MLGAGTAKTRGLQTSTEGKNGGLCVQTKTRRRKARGVKCYIGQQEEEEEEEEETELFVSSSYNYEMFTAGIGGLVTVVALLKSCTKLKDLHKGIKIHADAVRSGLLGIDHYVSSALVNMYAKCGAFAKAQQVLDGLPSQNVVSWNALIAGYAQQGHAENALDLFERMEEDTGFSPNVVTFVCVLKACGSMRASHKGLEVHTQVARAGLLGNNIMVSNALIDMYSKCGLLAKAQEVLDKLPVRDVFSWTALITGYTQHGHGETALDCFERMQLGGISPNTVTFVCILKACATFAGADKGQKAHADIVKKGLLEKDVVVANALVDMYAKCGLLGEAQEVFDKLPVRDVVSWNALIAGYVQHGYDEEALKCFERMRLGVLSPDGVTFVCILKACGSVGATETGQGIHAETVRDGLLEKDIVVGAALVDMYVNCGILANAREVFDKLTLRNVITWTALIAGYAHHGDGEEALSCFKQMQLEGLYPDAVTFVCVLQACGNMGAADKGLDIHAQIVKEGVLEEDMVVGTALVDMYANCGMLMEAREVFNNFTVRDVVSWNVLITRFAQRMHAEEALKCLERMQLEGFFPDPVTFVCISKACGSIGAAYKGQEVHSEICREGLVENDSVVGTALVDMYANCGMLAEAQNVFDKLSVQDLVSRTVLMAGYAQFGKDQIVFNLFDKMIGEMIEPNALTCTIMLNACSHAGLLEKGQMFFETMSTAYGIIPSSEHHNCMVDLLSRAGHLDKAVAMINDMPFSADLTAWHTVLGVCQGRGDLKLGIVAFEHATQLDEGDAATYVCMSNTFVAAGRQEHTDRNEGRRVTNQEWKRPAHC